jgi:hypothetical protein
MSATERRSDAWPRWGTPSVAGHGPPLPPHERPDGSRQERDRRRHRGVVAAARSEESTSLAESPAGLGDYLWRAFGQLRVVGGLTLPQRINDRPWIDTRARQAALDVLNSSPLRTGPAWHLQIWRLIDARATTLDFRADQADIGSIRVEAGAHLSLAGRSLSLLVALRWLRINDEPPRLPLPAFYWALLGSLVTVAATNRHVARALDAATVPAVTVAVHHASRERDPEPPPTAAKAGRWPGGSGPGTVKGAVLNPAPAGVHVPAGYRREPGGQRSGHVPASPVTAAARLRLSHHSTAPGKAPARKIPAGSGRRALTWPNTAPPELARAPVQIGSQPQQPAAMIWPHTARAGVICGGRCWVRTNVG